MTTNRPILGRTVWRRSDNRRGTVAAVNRQRLLVAWTGGGRSWLHESKVKFARGPVAGRKSEAEPSEDEARAMRTWNLTLKQLRACLA